MTSPFSPNTCFPEFSMGTASSLLMVSCLCEALCPIPTQPLPLQGLCWWPPMGLLCCPAVWAKGKSTVGDGPSLPAQVTFCPLGTEPPVLGHSLQKSINTAPSPLLRTSIRDRGPETVVTSSFLPRHPRGEDKIQQWRRPSTLLCRPRTKLLCTSTHTNKP